MALPRFIPCRVGHLTGELSPLFTCAERSGFAQLARVVEDLYHHYASARCRLAEDLYAPFDPDAETVPQPSVPEPDPLGRLFAGLEHLFEAANFQRASEDLLVTPGDQDVLDKLSIDTDLAGLERLAIYHRGRGMKARRVRPVRNLFRVEEAEIPTYGRVAVVVRTREEPYVFVKLFKDVPESDLQLLLPTVRVKMKLLDKLKLSGSGGAAAVSAWKTLRLIYGYTPTVAKLLAVPFKVLLLPVLVLVGGIYGGKTYLDYSKIRASYVTAMAEHLYSITMATNRAAISRLAVMAGEEDTKEVLLAFALLHTSDGGGLTPEELQDRAEAFVWDRYRAEIRFDVEDALDKLDELAIARRLPGGRRTTAPLESALSNVDRVWDELYAAPDRPRHLRPGTPVELEAPPPEARGARKEPEERPLER